MKFSKILIANRGEIAIRVIRSAKDLGFRTVAVFSDADKFSPHTKLADEAVYIGPSMASESYLNIVNIIAAAQASGADAIHPGYGFLSENAEFAQACQQADITFIGPSSEAIELMGSKRLAKIAMIAAGVPCIPGYQTQDGSNSDSNDILLIEKAQEIGFPVMVKASAGGGGRGMRLVNSAEDMLSALKSARSEAMNAFGSSELILEKALTDARHIEIQIFADTFGNVIHLAERDCSLQRRHQKVVEEAPSMAVSQSLREQMGATAVLAAKACNYVGAGTVEYLLNDDGNFYFLEMNTRLQVEHPVTELVTGLDLVAWQLNIANGEKLPLTQAQVSITGHAMEVRLYAEDPSDNFMPQTGNILLWQPALSDPKSQHPIAGVRVDSGIEQGQTVSPFYDPMLAKLIAYGDNREQARRRLIRLVQDSTLLGVRDNRSFLCQLLADQKFIEGKASTNYIGEQFTDNKTLTKQIVTSEEWCLAALLLNQQQVQASLSTQNALQTSFVGERLLTLNQGKEQTQDNQLKLAFSKVADQQFSIRCQKNLNQQNPSQNAQTDDWCQQIELVAITDSKISYIYAGVRKTRTFVADDNPANPTIWLSSDEGNLVFTDRSLSAKSNENSGSDQVLASMDGVVVEVLVAAGAQVKSGDVVAVIEAMKMEHLLKASLDGTIEKIAVSAGDQVQARQLIAQLAIK
jgi:geranyl-CoA carboxylase alpha subunit